MTIANWCVLTACILPIATIGVAKASLGRLSRKQGGYDNHMPREWTKNLTGWQSRAAAAQSNGFEALPIFIAAVLLAQQAHANQLWVDSLAGLFIVLRLIYVVAYLQNWGLFRSAVWIAGFLTCVGLFMLA